MGLTFSIPTFAEFERAVDVAPQSELTALHSGNLGDIIYALPTCRLLGVTHFILNVCSDPSFGNRVLQSDAAVAMAPLLLAQPGIRKVTVIKSNVPWEYANPRDLGIDFILDSFRASYAETRLHLLHQHALPFNLNVDGTRPWLTLDKPVERADTPYIVVGLTPRYRRYPREYYELLLRDVPADRVYFVGQAPDQMERMNLGGNSYRADSFLELARFIAGAALYIGNPSFAYALAESLKVPRLVELPPQSNVYPLEGTATPIHQCSQSMIRKQIFAALGLEPPLVSTMQRVRIDLHHYLASSTPWYMLRWGARTSLKAIRRARLRAG